MRAPWTFFGSSLVHWVLWQTSRGHLSRIRVTTNRDRSCLPYIVMYIQNKSLKKNAGRGLGSMYWLFGFWRSSAFIIKRSLVISTHPLLRFPYSNFATVSSWSSKFSMWTNRKLLALKVTSLWTLEKYMDTSLGLSRHCVLCHIIIKHDFSLWRACSFPGRMSWMCSHAQ